MPEAADGAGAGGRAGPEEQGARCCCWPTASPSWARTRPWSSSWARARRSSRTTGSSPTCWARRSCARNDLHARPGLHRPPVPGGRPGRGAPPDGRGPPAAQRLPVGGPRAGEGGRGRTPTCPPCTRCSGARSWAWAAATRPWRPSERELARNPNDFDANLYLGLFLKDEGRLDEAQEHLKRAGRLRSQDPAVLYALGSLHLAAGRAEEARKALETVTAQRARLPPGARAPGHRVLPAEGQGSRATATATSPRSCARRSRPGSRARPTSWPRLPGGASRRPRARSRSAVPARGRGAVAAVVTLRAAGRRPAGAGRRRPRAAAAHASTSSRREAERPRARPGASKRPPTGYRRRPWRLQARTGSRGDWALATLLYDLDRYAEAARPLRDAWSPPGPRTAWRVALKALCDYRLEGLRRGACRACSRRAPWASPTRRCDRVAAFHARAAAEPHRATPTRRFEILRASRRRARTSPPVIEAFGLLHAAPARACPRTSRRRSARWSAWPAAAATTWRGAAARRSAGWPSRSWSRATRRSPTCTTRSAPTSHPTTRTRALEEFRRELRATPEHYPSLLQIAAPRDPARARGRGRSRWRSRPRAWPRTCPPRAWSLGRALLDLGETERAVTELEKGAALAPESADLHFALARAYQRAGRADDAERARQEFLRLDRAARGEAEPRRAAARATPNQPETPTERPRRRSDQRRSHAQVGPSLGCVAGLVLDPAAPAGPAAAAHRRRRSRPSSACRPRRSSWTSSCGTRRAGWCAT